jgi:RNA recognition motif-containing protein
VETQLKRAKHLGLVRGVFDFEGFSFQFSVLIRSGKDFSMSRERDSMFRGNNNDCRIYVGNLPEDCRERDVEDIFYKYGRIADVRIKRGDANRARQSSRRSEVLSYAFVQFEDAR